MNLPHPPSSGAQRRIFGGVSGRTGAPGILPAASRCGPGDL